MINIDLHCASIDCYVASGQKVSNKRLSRFISKYESTDNKIGNKLHAKFTKPLLQNEVH